MKKIVLIVVALCNASFGFIPGSLSAAPGFTTQQQQGSGFKQVHNGQLLYQGDEYKHASHSSASSFKPPLHLLKNLEETHALVAKAQANGKITVKMRALGSNASNAMWVPDERAIYLNTTRQKSQGTLIRSVIFELHNAISQKEFERADALALQGRLSREQYVEQIEYIEYVNARNACTIIDKGIRQGLFPTDARWPIAPTFQEHYRIQRSSGHSTFIAQTYDTIVSNRR